LAGKADVAKTIGENLEKHFATKGPQLAPKAAEDAALTFVQRFTTEAKALQDKLVAIIAKIPGSTVAERANHFATNQAANEVIEWNAAIDRQYDLFHDNYLWTPPATACTVVTVA
jgi:hypothetical protein